MHEITKHLESNIPFIREKLCVVIIKIIKIQSEHQLTDILIKGLRISQHPSFKGLVASRFVPK